MEFNLNSSLKLIELIEKVNTDITHGCPFERTLHNILEIIYHNIKSKSIAVLLIDPSTEYLRIRSSIGISQIFINQFQRLIGTGIVGKLIRGGQNIKINNVTPNCDEYNDLKLELDFRSAVAARIYSHAKIYGYLICHRIAEEPFSQDELLFVGMMAQFISIALYQHRITLENIELTEIDKTTGILKFNAFCARVCRELERAKKKNEEISILLIDIDRFKDFHRSFGDDVAHQLVEKLIDIAKSNISGIDLIGKYGVDQITIALFDKNKDAALEIAEKIRSEMYDLDFYRSNNPVSIALFCCKPTDKCEINQIYDNLGISILNAHFKNGNIIVS